MGQRLYGGAAIAPDTPTRDDYTFVGWDVSFDYITGDLTVTALWQENPKETVVAAEIFEVLPQTGDGFMQLIFISLIISGIGTIIVLKTRKNN